MVCGFVKMVRNEFCIELQMGNIGKCHEVHCVVGVFFIVKGNNIIKGVLLKQ